MKKKERVFEILHEPKINFSGLCARRSLAIRSLFVSSAWDRG
jgi:hypothetical protein